MANESSGNNKMKDVSEHVGKVAEDVKQAASDIAGHGREAFDAAAAHAGDWTGAARGYVREKPARTIVMALAAGWMLGRLMRR